MWSISGTWVMCSVDDVVVMIYVYMYIVLYRNVIMTLLPHVIRITSWQISAILKTSAEYGVALTLF